METSFKYEPLVALIAIGTELANCKKGAGGYFCHTTKEANSMFTMPQFRQIGSVTPTLAFDALPTTLQMTLRILEYSLDYSSQPPVDPETAPLVPMGGIKYGYIVCSFLGAGFDDELNEAISLIFIIHHYHGGNINNLRGKFEAELERQPHYKKNSYLRATLNRFLHR